MAASFVGVQGYKRLGGGFDGVFSGVAALKEKKNDI